MAYNSTKPVEFKENTVIVIFGASGDLAKKKTFPALFGLFREGYLSSTTKIIGYARSKLTDAKLRANIEPHLNITKESLARNPNIVNDFFQLVKYVSGPYDTEEGFLQLKEEIDTFKIKRNLNNLNQLFYLALPPDVFLTVAKNIKHLIYDPHGINRIIVEKPFGKDLESARELQKNLAPLFNERELYRIDHYLGKELVKNILQLRFSNTFLNASWNKENIQSIQISFKEPFGTEGRGGYFDSIGIIRDVMQNHLLQILTLLTMERPISFDPEAVRDEKVKILKELATINQKDILIGQYGKSTDGTDKPSYLDDETVPKGSKCITYAALTFKIRNERWDGVPIIMRAGKALNEGKVEIRIQYKPVPSGIFSDVERNELVIRVQPDAAVYMKFNAKKPGLSNDMQLTDLDLTYSNRFKDFWIPEAYEVLIRDALLGDHSHFVRDDELDVSWGLFTPLLEYLEGPNAPQPEIYPYGSRGPAGLRAYLENHDFVFHTKGSYNWPVTRPDDEVKCPAPVPTPMTGIDENDSN
ncbi:hypothetical protein TBLA_0G00130 [Henningerozyma blattae CBS 6284]|uniref:Glucose-6-phosphate 1-dehydrogenase n=1 Tax=Henningerozyma blattae (strain ATCC 34711 / CBS 6284 / DSM 70876 / NBRC 10599 / NRRL Y-10934 / UCD 77-7) TaxID=1071380 RepID=I2H6G2_HENB6|nr:hypothetical protein TBLA_0G00130 [Tetrapisispora blattae CBS 6284]CCH61964.1 hypothetical protein TBLA_0G00130 [Tetrapisispora blattae CBS 6284]